MESGALSELSVNTSTAKPTGSPTWYRPLVALSDFLDRLTRILYVATTAIFASIMIAGVFFRYALNNSLAWSDELASIFFVWATFFAISTGYLNGAHINLDLLVDRLSPSMRSKVGVLAESLSGAFLVCMLVSGYLALGSSARGHTDALRLPLTVPIMAIPTAAVIMLVHWVRRNCSECSRVSLVLKLLFMAGFVWAVYLPLGTHLPLSGMPRFLLLFLSFVVPMLIGVPVAISLGIVGIVYVSVFGNIPFSTTALQMYFGVNVLPLMAIPLLILSGYMMQRAGMAEQLCDFAQLLVGRVRGGLGSSNVLASFLFGDIAGSAVSGTAAIGAIMIPEMKKRGYKGDFCAALQGAAGTLAMLAPLSITILLYAAACNQSVSRLAAATILPAFMVMMSFMLVALIHARRNGYPREYVPRSQYLRRILGAMPGLFALVLLAAGILGGVFTPAEVGTVLVFYIIGLMVFLYRNARPAELVRTTIEAGYTGGMTLFLVASSALLGFVLARDFVSQMLVQTISQVTSDKHMIIILVSLVFIVLGMVLEAAPMIYGILPSFMPVLTQNGVDPILWGVLFMINMGLGMIIPPVALNLFVSTQLAGVKYEEAVRASLPFIAIMVVDMVLVVVFPQIPLLLPNLLFGYPIR